MADSGNPVIDMFLASRYPHSLFPVLQACFSPSFLKADVVPLSPVSVVADVLTNNSLQG